MNGLIYWMSENILEWVFQVQFPKLRKTLTILLKFAISQFYQPSQVNFEIKLDEIPDILKYNMIRSEMDLTEMEHQLWKRGHTKLTYWYN